jgi:hypothetical protein
MSDNQPLLDQLQKLLIMKKSKKYYAERLGISETDVDDLLKELRETENGPTQKDSSTFNKKVNCEKGTFESTTEGDIF